MEKHKEIKVAKLMIERYCRAKHGTDKRRLCPECAELLDYVKLRSLKCPYKQDKPFCANCKIHCYKQDMRQKIRQVMRYSGPRMIFRHPIISIQHLMESRQKKADK